MFFVCLWWSDKSLSIFRTKWFNQQEQDQTKRGGVKLPLVYLSSIQEMTSRQKEGSVKKWGRKELRGKEREGREERRKRVNKLGSDSARKKERRGKRKWGKEGMNERRKSMNGGREKIKGTRRWERWKPASQPASQPTNNRAKRWTLSGLWKRDFLVVVLKVPIQFYFLCCFTRGTW